MSTARVLRRAGYFFLSLPLTKQSSLCKTLGPWRDQANSLQGLLKPAVINVLLSCGLFPRWAGVTDGRHRRRPRNFATYADAPGSLGMRWSAGAISFALLRFDCHRTDGCVCCKSGFERL